MNYKNITHCVFSRFIGHLVRFASEVTSQDVEKVDADDFFLLSIVISFLNEEGNLSPLCDELYQTLEPLGIRYEILFIDDGSTDRSTEILQNTVQSFQSHGSWKLIQLGGNFGKSIAWSTGFSLAKGQWILTLDADLQDDPREIPKFLKKLSEGHKIVNGWKKERRDAWDRRLSSWIFNLILSFLTQKQFRDANSGYKAYQREVVAGLHLPGGMHRLILPLLHRQGFEISEIPIRHRDRGSGHSKYGYSRIFETFRDLWNWKRGHSSPSHRKPVFKVINLSTRPGTNQSARVLAESKSDWL